MLIVAYNCKIIFDIVIEKLSKSQIKKNNDKKSLIIK